MIVAIDGPAGSGKSTVARILADRLKFTYIETGSMYRAVAWKTDQLGLDPKDEAKVLDVARDIQIEFHPMEEGTGQRLMVDGQDLTGKLKTETIGSRAAIVAANPDVRDILVAKQRDMGKNGNAVMDGRDIGTVVFPNAEKKFYLDADPVERARRRYDEMKEQFPDLNLDEVVEQVKQRDYEDKNRAASPLKAAEDAIVVDTSGKTIEGVVEELMRAMPPALNV